MFGQLFCINPFNDVLGWRVAECFSFFFLSGFLSRTLTTRRIAGEGREPSFIPIHHLSLLPAHEHSKIYFQLCMWDDYHIFLIYGLYLPDCSSMRSTTLSSFHLIDWWWDVHFCSFAWWFVTAICHGKPVESNLHQLSSMYYKRTN